MLGATSRYAAKRQGPEFQSSPALGAEQRQETQGEKRLKWKFQSSPVFRCWETETCPTLNLQTAKPLPALGAGSNCLFSTRTHPLVVFQSSPSLGAGSNRTLDDGRSLRSEFQSSPSLGAGSNEGGIWKQAGKRRRFNPLPA